jgi:pinin
VLSDVLRPGILDMQNVCFNYVFIFLDCLFWIKLTFVKTLQVFEEWKSVRRAELTLFQKQVEEQYLSNVERQLERIQNARNARRANGPANMQEMDKELDTHIAEHGPKTRRVPEEGGNDEDEDAEDMAAEDELMDEVLGINDGINEDPSKPSEEAATDGGEPPAPPLMS